MLLRQVQARPLQGDHLRALRRRGDAAEGPARAHGSHRPGGAGLAHLVLQGRAQPHRLSARHRSARAREGSLLRRLDRHAGRSREAAGGPRRPRGQGRRRERARVPRSRRGALGARRPPRPQARLLRVRQGEELRRGRRLLGSRPVQLGRGVGASDARRDPRARWWRLRQPREDDHVGGPAPRARARPADGDPRRPAPRTARGRVGRGGVRPDRGRARAASRRARQGERLEEGRDHEAPEAAPGGASLRGRALRGRRRARRGRRQEEPRARARGGRRSARRRARRGRSGGGGCGHARARVRPLPGRGHEEGGPRRDQPVGAEGTRDGGRHGDAARGHA